MKYNTENERFKTRKEVAEEIGISIRKLYSDIQDCELLREKIPKRGLLYPEHVRHIKSHYGL